MLEARTRPSPEKSSATIAASGAGVAGRFRESVTVLDNPNDPGSQFKDTLVTVEEKPSNSDQKLFENVTVWDVQATLIAPVLVSMIRTTHYLFDMYSR
jgi:hypothetical protein